jgi:hypothetical protein
MSTVRDVTDTTNVAIQHIVLTEVPTDAKLVSGVIIKAPTLVDYTFLSHTAHKNYHDRYQALVKEFEEAVPDRTIYVAKLVTGDTVYLHYDPLADENL